MKAAVNYTDQSLLVTSSTPPSCT